MRNEPLVLELNNQLIHSLECFNLPVRGQNKLTNFFFWNHPDQPKAVSKDGSHHYVEWCKVMIDLWGPFIEEGITALDIGASVGDTAIPMAHLVGDKGKVLAFEPGSPFKILYHNKLANPNLNIDAFNFAVTEEDGFYDFVYSGKDYNGGMLTKEIMIGHFPYLHRNVPGRNLFNVLEEGKYDRSKIKFIKVDTEGYDFKILNSIGSLIEENRPFLYTEWWCTTEVEMREFAKKYRYKSFNPFKNLEPVELIPQKRCDDILFIPEEKLP